MDTKAVLNGIRTGAAVSFLFFAAAYGAEADSSLKVTIVPAAGEYRVGQPVIIDVEIANTGAQDIMIVAPQDGSEQRLRFPRCFFEVKKEGGTPLEDKGIACKITDPLNRDGVVRIKPGEKVKLYPRGYDLCRLKEFGEGTYTVIFHYSTAAQKEWQWYGSYSDEYWKQRTKNEFWRTRVEEDNAVSRLLKKISRVNLVSNQVSIAVVNRERVSKEEALQAAEEICKQQGWIWEDVYIADNDEFWDIVTPLKTLGGNAFIRIDKRTGKVIQKHVTGP